MKLQRDRICLDTCRIFICPSGTKCSKKFKVVEASILLKRGNIQEKKAGIWDRDGKKVYFRCPSCAGVNRISSSDLDREGFVKGGVFPRMCICCENCAFHIFPLFEGWNRRKRP